MKTARRPSIKKNLCRIVVPKGKPRRFYGQGVPGVDLSKLAGKLIVVEGADGSGHPRRLPAWCNGWRAADMPPSKSA